jgi:hypothetical protein
MTRSVFFRSDSKTDAKFKEIVLCGWTCGARNG